MKKEVYIVEGKIYEAITYSIWERLHLWLTNRRYWEKVDTVDRVLSGKDGVEAALKYMGSKVRVIQQDGLGDSDGFCANKRTIVIDKDISEGNKFWTVVHELVHLKHKDDIKTKPQPPGIDLIWSLFSILEVLRGRETERLVSSWLELNS